MKNYNWCAKDGNVWYKDCERCRLHYYCDCDFRFQTHSDAVQKADAIRASMGLPLFSENLDAMEKSIQQGERTQKANLYGRRIMKRPLHTKQENAKNEEEKHDSDLYYFIMAYFVAFVSSFILAYVLQFCAIMTEWFFGILGSFLGLGDGSAWAETAKDSFFYATYGQAYIYALVSQHLLFAWMCNIGNGKWASLVKWAIIIYFVIASIAIPQLFISVAIGPLFILFCFAITAKK